MTEQVHQHIPLPELPAAAHPHRRRGRCRRGRADALTENDVFK
jgi:hypothetical protein